MVFSAFGFVLFRDCSSLCVFRLPLFILFFFIVTIERDDSLQSMSVRLDKKNNSYWSYVMRNFLKGKKMWGYVIGTCVKPKSTDKDFVASPTTIHWVVVLRILGYL